MEDTAIALAYRPPKFPIDLDDVLSVLKEAYSRKNHVVARLQNATLFELGKDYNVSKPPLSKHKYYLTPSCLQRLKSQRGVNVRKFKRAQHKQQGGGSLEQLQRVLKRLDELQEEHRQLNATLHELREEQRVLKQQGLRSIVQSIVECGYWKGGGGWVSCEQMVEGFRVCEEELRESSELDASSVREGAPGLYGMPCPRGIKGLRAEVWERLSSAFGAQYTLLKTNIITNDTKSSDQPFRRGVDFREKLSALLFFVLPLVEVTAERGPVELLCSDGSVVMTTRAGEMYGFDGYLEHRFTANRSDSCTPALVFTCCLLTDRMALMLDPRYST
jgi:hypothetical protein